jgi:hypothetical protein
MNMALNKSGSVIKNNKKWQITQLNPEHPVLKLFVKLHKPHSPIRSVVSYRQAPAYKVAEIVATFWKAYYYYYYYHHHFMSQVFFLPWYFCS